MAETEMVEVRHEFIVALIRREAQTAFLAGVKQYGSTDNPNVLLASYDYAAKRADEAKAALAALTTQGEGE